MDVAELRQRIVTKGRGAIRRGGRIVAVARGAEVVGERPTPAVATPTVEPPSPAAPPVAPPAPASVERFALQRPLPLPAAVDEAELRRIFGTFSIDGSPRGALDGYVADSFWRFVHTFGLVAECTGRALELGANPYFTTYLLHRHTSLELSLANYFGEDGRGTTFRQVLAWDDGESGEVAFDSQLFNLEEDLFPYGDGSHDVVLFCEIIEHLLIDPTHALREINRVLRVGGVIVLTTPNVARLENVLRIVAGESIGDPYSGNGPYGRHNREYSMAELHALLSFCGFEVERSFTADSHPAPYDHHPVYPALAPILDGRPGDLGHYLFVRARKVGPPRDGLPRFLFAAYPEERLAD